MPGKSKDSPAFHELLIRSARDAGFPMAGALDLDADAIREHVARYDRWLQAGHAGKMEYLVRGRDRRADPALVLLEARSILCVGLPYSARPAGNPAPRNGPRYSRYLQGGDYHGEIAGRLEAAMKAVQAAWPTQLKWKVCTDTSAVLERSWAVLAGLGWIGKNTLLIHPQFGSYFFLGEVLLDHPVGMGPQPLPDYCGSCTRCLKSCPTGAFTEAHLLDSNRCISDLTLERRGELGISEDLKRGIGTWVAGCDLCQEACPFNTKAARSPGQSDPGPTGLRDWRALLEESVEAYKSRVLGTALTRVKPAQFSRNLAITLGNVIFAAGTGAQDSFTSLRESISARARSETDLAAAAEWRRCLEILDQLSTPKRSP